MPTSKLTERVLSEQGAGKLTADVIRVSDPRSARQFAAAGVFAEYETPFEQRAIADGARVDPRFVTGYYLAFTMAYNSALIEEDKPTGWDALTDPRFEGQIGITSPVTSATMKGLVHFQIQNFGIDYLRAQAALRPRVFDSTSTQVDALARGEITVAPVNFDNALGVKLAGAPIELVIPEEGISASVSSLGLTAAGVINPAAQIFMNWSMSKAGQRFAAAQGFVPSRTDIDAVGAGGYHLPPANSPQFQLFTEADFGEYAAAETEMWKEVFGYTG